MVAGLLTALRSEYSPDINQTTVFTTKPQVRDFLRERGITAELKITSRGRPATRFYVQTVQRPGGGYSLSYDLGSGRATWKCDVNPDWAAYMNLIEDMLHHTNAAAL